MKKIKKEIVIYQSPKGAIELRGDAKKETVWATQSQIAEVFNIERSVVTKHLNNILKTKEVSEKSNVQKMHIANSDKPVAFYSLDLILAVGYRANSSKAIEFRQWATKILREHITKGYTINPARIKKNYDEFLSAVEKVKSLLPANMKPDTESILELIVKAKLKCHSSGQSRNVIPRQFRLNYWPAMAGCFLNKNCFLQG